MSKKLSSSHSSSGINCFLDDTEGKFFLKHFATCEEAATATRLSGPAIRECCKRNADAGAGADGNTGAHTLGRYLVFRYGPRPSDKEVDASVLVALKDQGPIAKKHLNNKVVFVPFKAVEVLSLDGTFLRRFEMDYHASWHIQNNHDDRGISVAGVKHAAVAPDSRMASFCWQMYEAAEATRDEGPVRRI